MSTQTSCEENSTQRRRKYAQRFTNEQYRALQKAAESRDERQAARARRDLRMCAARAAASTALRETNPFVRAGLLDDARTWVFEARAANLEALRP